MPSPESQIRIIQPLAAGPSFHSPYRFVPTPDVHPRCAQYMLVVRVGTLRPRERRSHLAVRWSPTLFTLTSALPSLSSFSVTCGRVS